jgi:hypothetical protein
MEKAIWSTKYINDLPDSCFAYIEPGGEKDDEGKTTPRSKRHLPYKDKDGKPDAAHVRNALARLPQTDIPEEAKTKAKKKLITAAKQLGIEVSEKTIDSDNTKIQRKEVTKTVKKQDEIKPEAEKVEAVAEATEAVVKADEPEVVEEAEAKAEVEEAAKADDAEEAVEETKEPAPVEEPTPAEEPKDEVAEKVDEPVEEAEAEEGEVEAKPDVDAMTKLIDAISQLSDKIDALVEKRSPDEGAAATEEAPVEKAEEEAHEEDVEKVDEAKVEPEPVKEAEAEAEPEVTKVDTSSDDDRLAEMMKVIEEQKKVNEDLQARLKKLEDMPAQAKVVVSRESTIQADSTKDELTKIETRLSEIADIRDTNPGRYTESLMDEALKLIAKRNALQKGL